MQNVLFAQTPVPESVVMSLNPLYYELIWQGSKRHEFRRRFLIGQPATWFVYLTAPVSRLAAVIDLDTAIVDTPQRIAEIAESSRVGNGASVYKYFRDRKHGLALPIKRVREYPGFAIDQLRNMLGTFHPPQGYLRVNANPSWVSVCEKLCSVKPTRELTVISQ